MKYVLTTLVILAATAVLIHAETECERVRKEREKSVIIGRLIPECDENGDYTGLQCIQGTKFCQCWDKEGRVISSPSRKTKACDCILALHKYEKHNAGPKPECEENGHWKPKQCWLSDCWCVDEKGNKIEGKTDC